MHEYDKLYAVSDLHLGGWRESDDSNFQIFNQGHQLAGLIDHIAKQAGKIALVLNGDVVDFLAEEKAGYLDPYGAPRRLERIMSDSSFKPVWDALKKLVNTAEKHLIIVLGNHDVELALPCVQDVIFRELCQDKAASIGRLHFETEGAGYACKVGGRRVLCMHGNEVDHWNVVDHRQLLEIARSQNRGMPLPDWTPNAGTKMVIDVMNPIKRTYPFVDLLKPETPLVPGVLLAIKPKVKDDLKRIGPVLFQLAKDSFRLAAGLLGEEDENSEAPLSEEEAMNRLYAAPLRSNRSGPVSDEVYKSLERRLAEETDSSQMMQKGMLGIPDIFGDRIFGGNAEASLRESVRTWLAKDNSFDFTHEDETFHNLDATVGPDIDFLIAGHTHLERSLQRKRGKGAYFNSGTWIRLMRVKTDDLDADEKYNQLLTVLRSNRMKDLDDSGYIVQLNTVVRLENLGGKVRGELCRVASTGAFELQPVPGSEREI